MANAPSQFENNSGVIDAKEFLDNQLQPPKPQRSKLENKVIKGAPVVVGAMVATGCAYLAINDPESQQLGPACGFYAVTGFYCPGCGMTRAVGNIVRLDFLKAFRFNALLMIALPIFIYLYVWWVTWSYTEKELPKLKMNKALVIGIFAVVVIFSVGRNFPGTIPEFFALGR